MIPPTPTPLPDVVSDIVIPFEYSLWGSTDAALTYWNLAGTIGQVIQVIILMVLVYAGIRILIQFFRDFTSRDSNE